MTQLWQRRLDRRRESSVPFQASAPARPLRSSRQSGEQPSAHAMSGARFRPAACRTRPPAFRAQRIRAARDAPSLRAAPPKGGPTDDLGAYLVANAIARREPAEESKVMVRTRGSRTLELGADPSVRFTFTAWGRETWMSETGSSGSWGSAPRRRGSRSRGGRSSPRPTRPRRT